MIIIGIDPGLATTGYGVIKKTTSKNNLKPVVIDFGCI
ncbi:MAG: crossover junction endodeoxyribonuclease RuvC, partial [Patescibacteria group bacterium]